MTQVGIYVGNEPEAFVQFEEWFGREVDFIRAHGGRASWQDHVGSLGWLGAQFAGLDVPIYWSVPMIINGASLAEAGRGAYNDHYRAAAQALLGASAGQGQIHVRIGEEFNGGWMPWAAKGKEADFIAAFREIVETFRSVSDKFVFEWNVNIGDMGMNPALAYPGDDVVDVIGMDFYWNLTWDPADPEAAWNYMVNRTYGLQWFETFAAAHGKPSAYSEWGVNSDNAGVYIKHAMEWFASHNVQYQSYWNSDADFAGKLSSGQYSATGAAFLEAFGGGGPAVADEAPDLSAGWTRWFGGTSGNDSIAGTAGNDKIDGGGGTDTMTGGQGDDSYTVDTPADRVVEGAGRGIDTTDCYASSYRLSANVENLALVATYAQTGIGNALDNRIAGSAAANRIEGGAGNDWLTGGGGNDTFVFAPGAGRDVITDFGAGDRIDLKAYGFGKFAALAGRMIESDGDVTIATASGETIRLFDVHLSELGADKFIL